MTEATGRRQKPSNLVPKYQRPKSRQSQYLANREVPEVERFGTARTGNDDDVWCQDVLFRIGISLRLNNFKTITL